MRSKLLYQLAFTCDQNCPLICNPIFDILINHECKSAPNLLTLVMLAKISIMTAISNPPPFLLNLLPHLTHLSNLTLSPLSSFIPHKSSLTRSQQLPKHIHIPIVPSVTPPWDLCTRTSPPSLRGRTLIKSGRNTTGPPKETAIFATPRRELAPPHRLLNRNLLPRRRWIILAWQTRVFDLVT